MSHRGGAGNRAWTPVEIEAKERLLAIIAQDPGRSGLHYWHRLQPRPEDWTVWDVTSVLLDLALGHPGLPPRLKLDSRRQGWTFRPAEAVRSDVPAALSGPKDSESRKRRTPPARSGV